MTTSAVRTQDLGFAGDGIAVGVPGIKIDLNGHRLTGDGGLGHVGVCIGRNDSVTVTNGLNRGVAR